jgi:hypothetical protein
MNGLLRGLAILLLIALLLFAAALFWTQFPGETAMIERLAKVALLIEAQTHWSFSAVSNLILLIFILVLLLAQQLLFYLTRLLMWIIENVLRMMEGREFRPGTLVSDRPPWTWYALLIMTWLLSIAVIRIVQLEPRGLAM